MPWINRVKIRNYRSIEDADLRFGNITIIIGASDSGKSCFVRAIRDWAYSGSGIDMVTVGKSNCAVSVLIGNHACIAWRKLISSNSSTYYQVMSKSHPVPREFTKFGPNCPPEVTAVSEMGTVEIDDLEMTPNLAQQSEPWFLLALPWTAGKVAKVVGQLAGIEPLMFGLRDATKDLSKGMNEWRGALKVYESCVADKEALPDTTELDETISSIKGKEKEVQDLGIALVLDTDCKALEGTIASLKYKRLSLMLVKEEMSVVIDKALISLYDNMSKIMGSILSVRNEITELNNKVTSLNAIKLKIELEKRDEADRIRIKEERDRAEAQRKREHEEELQRQKDIAMGMFVDCPTCGTRVKKDCIKHG